MADVFEVLTNVGCGVEGEYRSAISGMMVRRIATGFLLTVDTWNSKVDFAFLTEEELVTGVNDVLRKMKDS